MPETIMISRTEDSFTLYDLDQIELGEFCLRRGKVCFRDVYRTVEEAAVFYPSELRSLIEWLQAKEPEVKG